MLKIHDSELPCHHLSRTSEQLSNALNNRENQYYNCNIKRNLQIPERRPNQTEVGKQDINNVPYTTTYYSKDVGLLLQRNINIEMVTVC